MDEKIINQSDLIFSNDFDINNGDDKLKINNDLNLNKVENQDDNYIKLNNGKIIFDELENENDDFATYTTNNLKVSSFEQNDDINKKQINTIDDIYIETNLVNENVNSLNPTNDLMETENKNLKSGSSNIIDEITNSNTEENLPQDNQQFEKDALNKSKKQLFYMVVVGILLIITIVILVLVIYNSYFH